MSNYNIKNLLNFLLNEEIQADFTKNTAIPVLQKAFEEEGLNTLADFDQYIDDAKYDEKSLNNLKMLVKNILEDEFFPDIEEELVDRIVKDLIMEEISEAYKGPKKYKKVVGSGKNKRTIRYGAKGYSIAPGTSKGDSYCARSYGQMKDHPSAAKDPNSPLRLSRKKWKCSGKRSRRD